MRENWKRYLTLGQAPGAQISVTGLPQASAGSDCGGLHSRLQGARWHRRGWVSYFCPEWGSSSPEGSSWPLKGERNPSPGCPHP